jgi:hypothetical protein
MKNNEVEEELIRDKLDEIRELRENYIANFQQNFHLRQIRDDIIEIKRDIREIKSRLKI